MFQNVNIIRSDSPKPRSDFLLSYQEDDLKIKPARNPTDVSIRLVHKNQPVGNIQHRPKVPSGRERVHTWKGLYLIGYISKCLYTLFRPGGVGDPSGWQRV